MNDYIVRATAGNAQIRAFAAVTTNLVEEAREHHGTSPVATAALGRLLTGGVMMGSMMKNDTDMLTIQIQCSGQIEGLTVTADSKGNVKGYAFNPDVMLPAKNGKLDVGGALGQGVMTIIKDMGLKEPYSGQTILQTGEIAEDLTYYFATSEQVPSSIFDVRAKAPAILIEPVLTILSIHLLYTYMLYYRKMARRFLCFRSFV